MIRQSKFNVISFAVAITVLASCNDIYSGRSTTPPQDISPVELEEIDEYAKAFLDSIQPVSIAESREYCGFFVLSPDGSIEGTRPRAGTADSCAAGFVPVNAVASYHTHGGYLPDYFNEIPSVSDALSAIDVSLNDYVSTPGGRFWRVDGVSGRAILLCDEGCLTSDPTAEPIPANRQRASYTVAELRALQG